MPRLAVLSMPAAGHVNPTVPLVKELVRQGVDVTYFTDRTFGAEISHVGARWLPYPDKTVSAELIAESTRHGGPLGVVAGVLPAVETLVSFVTEQIRDDPVDAVAFDSTAIWGWIAAAQLGLPTISLMTTLMLTGADYHRLTLQEVGAVAPATLRQLPGLLARRRRLRRRVGRAHFPPPPTLPLRGDLTVFPFPRQLQPDHPLIDDRCHFVGSLVDATERGNLDEELTTHLAGTEPVVTVSLGTLHTGSPAFFRDCLRVVAGLPVRAVVAVGPSLDPASLGSVPGNTVVRATIPQLAVLARSDVFVTHGGMNSVVEGLTFGVPLVVIPQQVEQLAIGTAVAAHGAATVLRHHLRRRPVPPTLLESAIRNGLSNPTLGRCAHDLATTIGDGGGAPAAATLISNFVGARSRRHELP